MIMMGGHNRQGEQPPSHMWQGNILMEENVIKGKVITYA